MDKISLKGLKEFVEIELKNKDIKEAVHEEVKEELEDEEE